MKEQIKTFLTVVFAMVLGAGINNYAISDVPARIAVVDINKVVANSNEVKTLKKEQQEKITELQKWLTTVKADIDKQQTKEGKEKLLKKYDAEFAKKQEAIRKNYTAKLQVIDKQITNAIANEAKAQKYDLVLAKGLVLYGGNDITAQISKLVK